MAIHRVGDLEIGEDLPYQQKQWIVQRVSWGIWLGVLVVAMFGLFGNGWLADETVSDPSQTLTVDHNRIVRKHLPTQLKVTIRDPAAEVELWVIAALLHRVEISSIVPEPSEATAGPDGVTYLFNADDRSTSVDILFQWEYQRMGVIDARIGIVDGPFVDLSEIVLR